MVLHMFSTAGSKLKVNEIKIVHVVEFNLLEIVLHEQLTGKVELM